VAERRGEVDFQRVFDRLPAALVLLDPDLTVLAANRAFLALVGVEPDDIIGRPLLESFPEDPDDPLASGAGNILASFQRVREHRVADIMPIQRYDVAGPDGEYQARYWAPINAPVLAPDGSLSWIVQRIDEVTAYVHERVGDTSQSDLAASLRLRTARMEAQVFGRQRLREQNHALLAVLDSLDTEVIGCDREGRAVLTNRSARDLFGLPAGEDAAADWPQRFTGFEFADERGDPIAAEDLPTARVLRGEKVQNMVVVATAAGLSPRTFRIHGQPVADGGRLAAVVALHEVTGEQRAKQLKRCESEVADILAKPGPADGLIAETVELIGSMLGWAAMEFWSVDQVGQVLRRQASWSSAGLRNPGGLPDRLTKGAGIPGRAWHDGEPIWTTGLRHDHPVRRGGERQPPRAALAVPIPSGATVLGVLVCYSGHQETPDDIRTAVLTGIAAHVGEFLERRRAEQYATELDRSRDEYIALVGHELRTPLTSIQAYTDMLRTETDLSADERMAMLEVIHRNTSSLHDLIAKLLDVAGTRAGHVSLRTRRMDLAAVAQAGAEQSRAAGAAAHLVVNAEPSVIIDGDPDRLRDVVDELIANAVTWAPAGSTVGVTVHADAHTAVLSVSNTGPRIPAGEHARVFDLFYRTGDAVRNGLPGRGLGLALARAVVEQHGGTVTVSEPDEAATIFTLRLPTRRP
jgi:signal transduction histidine kinase/PAS domain-containing protein